MCIVVLFSASIKVQANESAGFEEFFGRVKKLADTYDDSGGLSSTGLKSELTNRLIVKTKTNKPLNNYYGAIAVVEGYDGLHFLQYQNKTQAQNAYISFSFEEIEYVEYDFYMSISNDITFDDATTLNQHLSWNSVASHVDEGLNLIRENEINCSEIRIAVIDSGTYAAHDFFKNTETGRIIDSNYIYEVEYTSKIDNSKYTEKYSSMDDSLYHGTHISGTIFDNTMENVKIIPYRITNERKVLYSDILSAFESILVNNGIKVQENIPANTDPSDDIDIVNMSFEGDLDEIDAEGITLSQKISLAVQNGMIIITAAGNRSKNANFVFPACHPDVITVSATDEKNIPATFSGFGDSVDVAAPGTNINSTTSRTFDDDNFSESYSAFEEDSGTSFAAPLVSAAAATLKSIDPNITPTEVKRIIKETAYVPDGWDTNYGTGIVNFYNMVKAVLEPETSCQPLEIKANNGKIEIISPEGLDARIYYTIDGSVPTVENHIKYTEPVSFRNNYVEKIIAVCHENGKLISEPITYGMINHRDKTIFCKWSKNLPTYENSGKATWYSRNPEIASVDESGRITGVSPGNTDIVCRYPTGERVTWNVKVQYSPVQLFFIICFFGFLWI